MPSHSPTFSCTRDKDAPLPAVALVVDTHGPSCISAEVGLLFAIDLVSGPGLGTGDAPGGMSFVDADTPRTGGRVVISDSGIKLAREGGREGREERPL